jgi:Domain of unknown function (DUF4157)
VLSSKRSGNRIVVPFSSVCCRGTIAASSSGGNEMRVYAARTAKNASQSKLFEPAVNAPPFSMGHRPRGAVEQAPAYAGVRGLESGQLLHPQPALDKHRLGGLLRPAYGIAPSVESSVGPEVAARFRHEFSRLSVHTRDPAVRRSASEIRGTPAGARDSASPQGQEFAPPIVHAVLRLSGEPLEMHARALFESRFARNFCHVRVHRDAEAARSAEAVGAAAYTVGHHVVFGNGRYNVASVQGQRLIAHELVHTIQQAGRAPGVSPLRLSRPDEPGEQEAEHFAQMAMSHTPVTSGTLTSVPSAPASHTLNAIGNRAVALTVARQVPHPQTPVPLEEVETDVPPADRRGIELATAGLIPLAFTAFSNATAAHVAAIKNEAKAQAEIYKMVVDVAAGFFAPVFANWMVGAMAAKVTEAAVSEVTKKAAVKLISQQDIFKATFTGATKIANQVMASNANALFGETEIEAFALALRNRFQQGAEAILNRVTTLSINELLTVWIAYGSDYANETAYRKVLAELFKRYQEQVEPIGTTTTAGLTDTPGPSSRLYEVQLATRKRLATLNVWSGGEKYLRAWVTPDMEAIARAKATALRQGIPTIAIKDVGVTLDELLDPPQPTLHGKDMFEIVKAMGSAERQRAASDPDFVSVVETGRELDGRIPDEYERHKTLFLLRGYSSDAIACVDELASLFPSAPVIVQHLHLASAAERGRLAQDPWFVGRVRAELPDFGRAQVLFALGLGPAPKPLEPAFHYEHVGP